MTFKGHHEKKRCGAMESIIVTRYTVRSEQCAVRTSPEDILCDLCDAAVGLLKKPDVVHAKKNDNVQNKGAIWIFLGRPGKRLPQRRCTMATKMRLSPSWHQERVNKPHRGILELG